MLDIPAFAIPSFIAGFLYILAPGPVFIGMLSLVSFKGCRKGFELATGAFIGDVVWLGLTYGFLIGTNIVPHLFMEILNAVCGTYLFYIAYKMIQGITKEIKAPAFNQPFYNGLALGLLNPKSYPVAISLFSSLMGDYREALQVNSLPILMLSAAFGMIMAYTTEILLASIPLLASFYKKHWKMFTIIFAVFFGFFGIKLWSELL